MPRTCNIEKCKVLVIGGAGFLGQHIIGLLQSRASHLTEIRVLDIAPYVRNLSYQEKVPVRHFRGSVLDVDLVQEACTCVDSVLHIASVIDMSLLPDEKRSYDINVVGTQNVVDACRQCGVKRLLYCSTLHVVIGKDGKHEHLNMEKMERTDNNFQHPYATTKSKAEQIVLAANDHDLTTLSLRPGTLYGEQDHTYLGRILKISRRLGGRNVLRFDCKGGKMMHVYAGNVAWCFVHTENLLATRGESLSTRVGGQAYFVGDETPWKSIPDFADMFFEPLGFKPLPFYIPIWMPMICMYVLYYVLAFVSLFYRVNISEGLLPFQTMARVYHFSYEKTTTELDYKPLYTFEQAKDRTIRFLKYLNRTFETNQQ